jgi:hypothetical protein
MVQMRQVKFRALITLDPAGAHPGTPLHPTAEKYLNHTRALMVRARSPRPPGHARCFPAEICWDDDQPLHPGERAEVTITVRDDEADAFFDAGLRFALWSGSDVGHGIVSRRVFTDYAPC